MAKTITSTQQFGVTVNPTDKKGNPAPIEAGSAVWASSNDAVASVVPDENGGALVVAQGIGTADISVSVDADLGAGVTTLVGVETVNVTIGGAVAVSIVAGAVEEQP